MCWQILCWIQIEKNLVYDEKNIVSSRKKNKRIFFMDVRCILDGLVLRESTRTDWKMDRHLFERDQIEMMDSRVKATNVGRRSTLMLSVHRQALLDAKTIRTTTAMYSISGYVILFKYVILSHWLLPDFLRMLIKD
jgi:hypothetical protein